MHAVELRDVAIAAERVFDGVDQTTVADVPGAAEEVEVLAALSPGQRPQGFELPAYWRSYLADFDRRRITGVARLRISPELMARLDDLGDAALRAAAAAGCIDPTGCAVFELPIESPGWAATQLIRYGGDLEVLDPPEVREAIWELAESVLARQPGRVRDDR